MRGQVLRWRRDANDSNYAEELERHTFVELVHRLHASCSQHFGLQLATERERVVVGVNDRRRQRRKVGLSVDIQLQVQRVGRAFGTAFTAEWNKLQGNTAAEQSAMPSIRTVAPWLGGFPEHRKPQRFG